MDILDDDDGVMEKWTCGHFSLSNPIDDRPSDLPHLLRRLAEHIEAEGITAMEIQDVTISQDMSEHGPWWSATLYWTPDEPTP